MKLKESMRKHGRLIKSFISFIAFMLLFFTLFSKITYLFRNADYNRLCMIGLQAEENLDVIYIGPSATYRYFEPLKAWNDCGFTSYDYSTSAQPLTGVEYYVKEALETQNPSLFIIEMRSFINSSGINEAGLRYGADSMKWWSVNRWKYINSYMTYHPADEDTDVISYYFDIAKYHTNLANLSSKTAWEYSDNVERNVNKGYIWSDKYNHFEEPIDYLTDERIEIPEECVEVLDRLLDYCDEQNLQVLFVLSPRYISANEMSRYNTLKDIIEARGYTFLNTNEYYYEMSLDFSTDLYDRGHVNCFGAEKYTQFLEEYLVNNYDLPDHRGDPAYTSWDEEFKMFSEEETKYKSVVIAKKEDYDRSLELEEEIIKTTNFKEWSSVVKDSRYYAFFAQRGIDWDMITISDELLLNSFGLYGTDLGCSVFNSSVIASDISAESFEFSDSISSKYYNDAISYYINNIDGQASIMIDGIEYSRMDDGINAVVVDTILGRIVDSVTLYVNDEGIIWISR